MKYARVLLLFQLRIVGHFSHANFAQIFVFLKRVSGIFQTREIQNNYECEIYRFNAHYGFEK